MKTALGALAVLGGIVLGSWASSANSPDQAQNTRSQTTRVEQALVEMDAAERGFAAASMRDGITPSFIAYVAPGAIIFRPGPVDAPSALAADTDTPGITLDWWPSFQGMSSSADLGYSVGPWLMERTSDGRRAHGYYVTLWRKQADGQWKFVLDGGGARLREAAVWPRDRAAVSASTPMVTSASGQTAFAAEDALHAALATDYVGATMALMAPQSLATGSGVEPQLDAASTRAELGRRRAGMRYQRMGSGASSSGHLVYTYGAVDAPADANFHAHYVRIWQRHPEGWRIAVDALSPDQ